MESSSKANSSSLICEGDTCRLENIKVQFSESAPAQCVHLHLWDAIGTMLNVELSHCQSEGHHHVGIKEDTECEREPQDDEVVLLHGKGSGRLQHHLRNSRAGSGRRPSNAEHVIPDIKTEEVDFTLTFDVLSLLLDVWGCEPPLPAFDPLSFIQSLHDK